MKRLFSKILYELRGQMLEVKKMCSLQCHAYTHTSSYVLNQGSKWSSSSKCARGNPWSGDQKEHFIILRPVALICAGSCALIFVRIWMNFQQPWPPNLKYAPLFSKTTVDGRNPAPVDRWFIPLFIGFQPSSIAILNRRWDQVSANRTLSTKGARIFRCPLEKAQRYSTEMFARLKI